MSTQLARWMNTVYTAVLGGWALCTVGWVVGPADPA